MNIIITGGSNGIGRETALYLSMDKNNQVLITGRKEASLSEVAKLAPFGNIKYLVSDLLEIRKTPGQPGEMIKSILGSVDILINNAGCLHAENFDKISDDDIREMMEVNFFGPMSLIKQLLPVFNAGGHILNISSMGGFQGSVKFPGLSYYSATKAALACITECLSGEFFERKISVNCLALGSVKTKMIEKAFPGYEAPVTAKDMGKYVGDFALNGGKIYNGKVLPAALITP